MKNIPDQCLKIKGDDMDYLVNFDYQPEEPAVWDLNSPMCGPGCDEEININEISIRPHGYTNWIQTDISLWSDDIVEFLTSEISADVAHTIRRQRDDYLADQADFDCRR